MVSIITSLYKSDAYLDAYTKNLRIFSKDLLVRNFDFEVLVIANDPTEQEKQLEKDFAGSSWFRFVPVGRETLYATWNRGVNLAKGSVIGFWNVDDVRYAEALLQTRELVARGAEFIYYPFYIKRYIKIFSYSILIYKRLINKQIPEFNQSTKPQFLSGMLCGPFFMFTKSFYEKVGPFDEQFKIAGDFDWCIRAAKATNYFTKAKTIAGTFRVDGGGLSAGANERLAVENNTVSLRHNFPEKFKNIGSKLTEQYNPKIIKHGSQKIIYT